MLYRLARPALFRLDPETAHRLALATLRRWPHPRPPRADPRLVVRLAGLTFPNPVGLAAGFDKDGIAPDALLARGFGFVEVGSITPRAQVGNPQPRLFRLTEDRAVLNRMGFNNGGAAAAAARLARRGAGQGRRATGPGHGAPGGVLGINIGANKDAADRVADYAAMAQAMAPFADYLAINVSSPNTPGLRALQDPAALAGVLDAVMAARGAAGPPVFLKVAPDLAPADIDAIARVAIDGGVAALIVANTTVSRPPLASRHAGEAGGLSGAPLKPLALACLRAFARATGGAMPLVGVGGIATAADAYERIRAGATLVQLYSAMVYEGPQIARTIARGLARLMARDGFASIAEMVGTE